jgi:hypothetical protein
MRLIQTLVFSAPLRLCLRLLGVCQIRSSHLQSAQMRHWLIILTALALITAAIGCEKTVYEPGESEHGGVFLHGSPPATTSP